jgi:hypothetical protein
MAMAAGDCASAIDALFAEPCSHIEATSGIFGTGLNYVAMRLLGALFRSLLRPLISLVGVPANDFDCARARKFLLANGGCSWIPQWGKVWFACLGIYSWDGINAIPPEFWGLPYWVPFHPGRWWCHCRCAANSA